MIVKPVERIAVTTISHKVRELYRMLSSKKLAYYSKEIAQADLLYIVDQPELCARLRFSPLLLTVVSVPLLEHCISYANPEHLFANFLRNSQWDGNY